MGCDDPDEKSGVKTAESALAVESEGLLLQRRVMARFLKGSDAKK